MSKIAMGFDFGTKYIGIAVGQTITKTATAVTTVKAKDGIPNWKEILDVILHYKPEVLIVGLPINMDGSMQNITYKAKKFARRLQEQSKIQVLMHDERLSSWDASQSLGIKKNHKKYKHALNAAAAATILTSWLEVHQ